MAYITEPDFEQAFGEQELSDLLSDAADFAQREKEAAGLIDGYLASKYKLPLASVPECVKAWALDITRYRLWEERAPDEVRRRYDSAMSMLRDVALGRFQLPPDAAGTPPTLQFEADGYSNTRVFTEDTLKCF